MGEIFLPPSPGRIDTSEALNYNKILSHPFLFRVGTVFLIYEMKGVLPNE